MWYAKPKGEYAITSTEGTANIFEIYNYLSSQGYTKECVAGICANIWGESRFNPWRWEGDVLNTSKGYGLFQFTPAWQYLGIESTMGTIPYFAPNPDPNTTASSARATDGIAQLYVFANDKLAKWLRLCWREGEGYPLWNAAKANNAQQWQDRRRILNKYVSTGANFISQSEFKVIDNVYDATFVFFACYEGPYNPDDVNARYPIAEQIYKILGGTPPVPSGKKMKLIYYLKRRY